LSKKEAEIRVTVVGRLRSKAQYEVAKINGELRGTGYGHLGIDPGRLVVKTIGDPEVRPKGQKAK